MSRSPADAFLVRQDLRAHEEYIRNMSLGLGDKLARALDWMARLHFDTPEKQRPLRLVSIGGGDGRLEQELRDRLLSGFGRGLLPVAVDLNHQMSRSVQGNARQVEPVDANALDLPLARGSQDAVLLFSVLHEVASFVDQYEYGSSVARVIQEAQRVLRPGGLLLLREFVLPEEKSQPLTLVPKNVPAQEFVASFLKDFPGFSDTERQNLLSVFSAQGISVTAEQAFEIAIHYSWRKHYADEVPQRYGFKTLTEMRKLFSAFLNEHGEQVFDVLESVGYVQPGYTEHIGKGIDLFDTQGSPWFFPQMTGFLALRKR